MKTLALGCISLFVLSLMACSGGVPENTQDIDATVTVGVSTTPEPEAPIDVTVEPQAAATLTQPDPTEIPSPGPTQQTSSAETPATTTTLSQADIVLARVGDHEFTANDLVQHIQVLEALQTHEGHGIDHGAAAFQSLQDWVLAGILRQEAGGMGIQPNEEAIESELHRRFLPTLASEKEADPDVQEQEFQASYQAFLTAANLTDPEYRAIAEQELIELALSRLLAQGIENPQEQVEVRWIRLPIDPEEPGYGEVEPSEVMQRLQDESFETVARELSRSAGYSDESGYVGWVPQGAFPELDPSLYGAVRLEPGYVSRPYFLQNGVYIVEVLSSPEAREIDDRMMIKLAAELVKAWKNDKLQTGVGNGYVMLNFNSSIYEWVTDQVENMQP
jgi:hypothetical protein